MNQVVSYLYLQWKRTFQSLIKAIAILLLVAIVLGGLFYTVGQVLKAKDISLVRVGMVIPEDEATSKYVMDIIGSMDSVKSICSFEYVSELKAIEGYNDGTYEAVVILPLGFYHDVQVGLNPPAKIYVPENAGLMSYLFRELLVAGVSYLQTAEAAVYATLDVSSEYGSKIERSQIGNVIALKYLDEVFGRNKVFSSEEISVFKNISMDMYYSLALLTILLMFSGIIFNKMYGGSNKSVDNMLKIRGINVFIGALLKIIVMIPYIFITGMVFILLQIKIAELIKITPVKVSLNTYGWVLLLAVTLAIYFQIIYGITDDAKKGIFVLIIINTIGAICSGLIIPSAYMAEWTNLIGNILPMKYWMSMLYMAFGLGGAL